LHAARHVPTGVHGLLKISSSEDAVPGAFGLEQELFRSLHAPGLAQPLDFPQAPDGTPALFLPAFPGQPMEAALMNAPLPWRDALRIATAVGRMLSHLHSARIVHKDLRPANLLVDLQQHEILLVDLHVAATGAAHSPAWSDPASAAYLAPEQTGSIQCAIDRRADLYAMGVLLYRLLTGRLPFQAADALEWVHCHLARVPRPPLDHVPMPRGVSGIVMKLLAKSPDERYQSAAGLLLDIERCLGGTDAQADKLVIGKNDVRDQLQLARKLYGREAERTALLSTFVRVHGSGDSEFVVLAGEAGSGKTMLAHELRPAVAKARGHFITGKFDRYRRDVPYAAFAEAFGELIKHVLGDSEAGMAVWRDRVTTALGGNAQLMVQLVPSLAAIVGEQPAVPPLPPREAEARFQLVFQHFVGAIARAETPLVLFLDDLQWADSRSIELLRELLGAAAIRGLLLVGAYREDELTPHHPLRALLEKAHAGRRVTSIALKPLPPEDVSALVADAVGMTTLEAATLVASIAARSGGNPLFATHFLLDLAEEGLLVFDVGQGRWTWDAGAIAARGYTQDIAELLAAKLRRLPAQARSVLQHAACFGGSVARRLLAAALGKSLAEIEHALAPAREAGLILHGEDEYRFAHDRVQEAAYALIPQARRAELRLRMGRLLLHTLDEKGLDERIFDVVGALNDGCELIEDAQERTLLRRLNARAGAKAKLAADPVAAERFFARAVNLLPEDPWSTLYGECFSLHVELGECAYLNDALDHAFALVDGMLEHARTKADKAVAYRLKISVLTGNAPPGRTAEASIEALRQLDLAFPEDPSAIAELSHSLDVALDRWLAGRPVSALLELPRTDDPEVVATMAVLVDAFAPLFIARPALCPLVGVHLIDLSLRRGCTVDSSLGFQLYADLHGGQPGKFDLVEAYSSLALRTAERFGDTRVLPKLLLHQAMFTLGWRHPWSECRRVIDQGIAVALERGDLWHAGPCVLQTVTCALEQGEPLESVISLARRAEAFFQRPRLQMLVPSAQTLFQVARCLQGETSSLTSLDEGSFSEAAIAAGMEFAPDKVAAFVWRTSRQLLFFFAGEPARALEEASHAGALIAPPEGRLLYTTHHLFRLLALAALFDASDAKEQEAARMAFREFLPLFETWARECPANQLSRYKLLCAECARIEGRDTEVAPALEEAIQAAHRYGNTPIELVAAELAARFHVARGLPIAASGYVRRAHEACTRWGAHGVLRGLQARYPELTRGIPRAPEPDTNALAIAKASQAVSSPLAVDQLAEALMRIAMQAAGAQTGWLLLADADVLRPAAQARVTESGIWVGEARKGERPELPWTLLHYVARTRESVTLSEGSSAETFWGDPYIVQRMPKSALCVPLVRGIELIGLLYVEHGSVSGAFPAERAQLLAMLAAQAAISLEAARLYASLQEREARIRRLVDANIIGIRLADATGRIFDANEAFLQLVGYGRADTESGRLNEALLTPVEYGAADERAAEELRATGRYAPFEKEYLRADGTRVPVLIGGTWLDAEQQSTLAFVLDLSERRLAEAERAARRVAELANEAKSEFLASMSHELRTPLNAILGYAQLIPMKGPLNAPQRRGLDTIRRSGQHLLELINDILDLARIEAGRIELSTSKIVLPDFLRSVAAIIQVKAEEKGLHFQLDMGEWLAHSVLADERRLLQVLLNLLGNAVKFTDQGSVRLRVRSELIGDDHVRLRLEVEDTGVGIHPDHHRLIFEPFEQVGDESRRTAGTGLGLAITRAIVHVMGGQIRVDSAPGRGSRFSFDIAVPLLQASERDADALPAVSYRGPRRRVLIVDDVPENRALLTDFLTSAGLTVEQAVDGAEALQQARILRPDLIIMDNVMPGMSGVEVTMRLRALDEFARVPIIAISASATAADRRRALDAGANVFLSKPVVLNELMHAIAEQLGTADSSAAID
jgi:PAS domain S-box-containing protein